jgi:hypothetical protein
MAVIKLKYTLSRRKIKAHVRYITHRPGREGERRTRPLFSRGGEIEKADAYRLIDQTPKGQRFYKLIISPDPKTEDIGNTLDLWQIATKTLSALESQLQRELSFIAVLHNDHSDNRHVHLVFVHAGALTRLDIRALRQAATRASGGQLIERRRFRERTAAGRFRLRPASGHRQPPARSPKPLRLPASTTRFCGTCLTFTSQCALDGNRQFCRNCRTVQGPRLTLGLTKEAEWER